MPRPPSVERFKDDVHVIGDNVWVHLDPPRRAKAEEAFKLIEELRQSAIRAAEIDMSLVEEEKVVIAFDFSLDGDDALVRVMQVAE